MYTSLRTLLTVAILGLAVGCGGGASKTDTQTGPSATVTVNLDGIMTQGTTLVLPVYISHLYGSAVGQDVATITIKNTGTASTTYIATIDLPSYASAPGTKTVTIAAGASQTFPLSPALNLTSLFALTTGVPGQLNVKVMAGATQVYQNTTNVQISGRNTVFWSEGGKNVAFLVTTMVTPHDKALKIAGLAHDAGLLFPGGSLLGYQAGGAWPAQSTVAIPPGGYAAELVNVLAGESLAVAIDGVVNGIGTADTANIYIMDAANFTTFTSGAGSAKVCGGGTMGAPSTVTCVTPPAGTYYFVYANPASNFTSRTVTRHRPMLKTESTYEQSRAIFTALRNRGMIYANLPGGTGFFGSSQSVMYPSESLLVNNANCIEGSLVFASLFEAMGMEPILVVDFAHGHAFMGVRCWAGTTSCVIPIETTMVGGAATFDAAVSEGIAKWTAWTSTGDNSATLLDVGAVRTAGITPAPM